MKTAIVVPTNRLDKIQEFIGAWESQFRNPDVRLLVIEDHPLRQIELPDWIEHYCHFDFKELGGKACCIPTFSGGCRSFGIWKSAQDTEVDMIVSLDDDCMPNLTIATNFIRAHWEMLENPRLIHWFTNTTTTLIPRGYPYGIDSKGVPYGGRIGTKAVLNHGLWHGIPDIDAITQLSNPGLTCEATNESETVPWGNYFPMSIMNVAFRRELAPIMYFPIMPDGMKRWDDIWCGIIMKKICDAHGWPVTSGFPCIHHTRASNVWNNLKQEVGGLEINERFWQVVDAVPIEGKNIITDYTMIVRAIWREFPELGKMVESMLTWSELWGAGTWKIRYTDTSPLYSSPGPSDSTTITS